MAELRSLIAAAADREPPVDGLLLSVVAAPTPPMASLATPVFALASNGLRERLVCSVYWSCTQSRLSRRLTRSCR